MSENNSESNGVQTRRNKATRIFATEFNKTSTEFEKSEDRDDNPERAPKYYLTPTGFDVHRVLVVGTLYEVTKINKQPKMYRARIRDQTGTFSVVAGKFNKDIVGMLEEWCPDGNRDKLSADKVEHVMVMGKPDVYTADNGERRVTLTPEFFITTDLATRNRWEAEAAKFSLRRLNKYENGDAPFGTVADKQYNFNINGLRDSVEDIAKELTSGAEKINEADLNPLSA